MNMYPNKLDAYEAEIVEDIPEQFDLARYKKSSSKNPPPASILRASNATYPQAAAFPSQSLMSPNYIYPQNNIPPIIGPFPKYDQCSFASQIKSQYDLKAYQLMQSNSTAQPKIANSSDMLSNQMTQPQQFLQFNAGYQTLNPNQKIIQHPPQNMLAQAHPQQLMYNLMNPQFGNYLPTNEFQSMQISQYPDKKKSQKNLADTPSEASDGGRYKSVQKPGRSDSAGRKKNSFDDDDDAFRKKEYFLKGGDDLASASSSSLGRTDAHQSILKSNLKPKKQGVTFDEKLEVYEVKNPHYGLDVKSEKREMKRKRKDKQKEEDIVNKTKLELKNKIQNQNMTHYNFYQKSLVYNALVFYEESYYRASVMRLQEKLRNSKPDEKLRDQLIQSIEKDNQMTIDIIKHIQKDYITKLEPYLNQYQTTVDKIHTIPGMYQVLQNVANTINYSEIINFHINKEISGSPTGLRKILGHESRSDRLNSNQIQIKSPLQRKSDLFMPKFVIAAIDSHVKDIGIMHFKTITEMIYKLNEVSDCNLNLVRSIYKYLLTTQLESFRRNDTGSLIMRNYDLGIESTNTIFSRLCSFAGIENHLVRGIWKTICQEPGEKVETKSVWNIVNLECGWRFVQPAFTPVKYFLNSDITYEETEFYFLSDFDSLFYEFLPNDKQWQFTDAPLSNFKENLKEFEKNPIITPQFRTLNLSIIDYNKIIAIGKEPFKLEIKYPSELSDSINFKYILKLSNNSNFSHYNQARNLLSNESEQSNSNLYVISEHHTDQNSISIKIFSLPEAGSFNFTIYASLIDDHQSSADPTPFYLISNLESKAILSFKLTCSKPVHFEIPPNRITDINVFGTNLIMKRLGLTLCDFKQGILGTDREGKINLVFQMDQPLDLEAYLFSSDPEISSKCLELCILKRIVHNFLIIIINPPHPGLYGLDLHGAPRESYNSLLRSQLPPIGKFLIKCHYQLKSFCQYPKGDNRQWGPKQRFYDLGMHTVGNMDPYVVNEDGKQIEIEIAMLKSLTLWYRFDYDNNGTPKPIDEYCFMNYKHTTKHEKTVSFLLRFPYKGFYHLAIMAHDDVFPTPPDEIVFNYLIRVQDPSSDVEPFPTIIDPILWKDCCLIAPKNYRLNTFDVHFSMLVPRTNQVQITNGERFLDKLEPKEIENSWVGLVSIFDSKYVYIEAQFENKFKKLIKFKTRYN